MTSPQHFRDGHGQLVIDVDPAGRVVIEHHAADRPVGRVTFAPAVVRGPMLAALTAAADKAEEYRCRRA